jgi:hypothetical protein
MARPPAFDIFSLDLIVPAAESPEQEDFEREDEPVEEKAPEIIPKPEESEPEVEASEPEVNEPEPEVQRFDNIVEVQNNDENNDGENDNDENDNDENNDGENDAEEDADGVIPNPKSDIEQANTASILDIIEAKLALSPSPYVGLLHQILERLVCPISHDLPEEPVIGSDGNTYDAKFLEKWTEKHKTSPVSREKLKGQRFPNRAVKQITEVLKHAGMNWIDGPAALQPNVYRRMKGLRAERYLQLMAQSEGMTVQVISKAGKHDLRMSLMTSTLDDLALAYGYVADIPVDVDIRFRCLDEIQTGEEITYENWDRVKVLDIFELVEQE